MDRYVFNLTGITPHKIFTLEFNDPLENKFYKSNISSYVESRQKMHSYVTLLGEILHFLSQLKITNCHEKLYKVNHSLDKGQFSHGRLSRSSVTAKIRA